MNNAFVGGKKVGLLLFIVFLLIFSVINCIYGGVDIIIISFSKYLFMLSLVLSPFINLNTLQKHNEREKLIII